MAATTTPPPPLPLSINSENRPTPPQSTQAHQEAHQSPPPQPQPQPSHFINSITELSNLSTVLSTFHNCYTDLQDHLDFIQSSIHSLTQTTPPQDSSIVQNTPATEPSSKTPPPPQESPTIESPSKTHVPKPPNPEPKPKKSNKIPKTELEKLCHTMFHRNLRKYLLAHLSNTPKLRKDVPRALKFAPNPSKLVLDCLGRFFIMGKKAFKRSNTHIVRSREASIFILECFLILGCDGVEIDVKVKEEAEMSAMLWKNRMMTEGGIGNASQIDARGLLLLIGCFGIPSMFNNTDIRDLIRAGNVSEICGALRNSAVLLDRIPGIIEEMLETKMEIEAVDIAYSFVVYDRFSPQTILTSFLKGSEETWKGVKAAENSTVEVNQANRKLLADLKLVIKCLGDHNVDPTELLPEWQINDRISSLEKEIADLGMQIGEKATPKRKVDETESSEKLITQEVKKKLKTPKVKHLRLSGPVLKQQKAVGYVKGHVPYDGLKPKNMLDSGLHVHPNGYHAFPSALHGPGPFPLPETTVAPIAGHRNSVFAAGVGAVLPTGQPYGWHGDAALNDRFVAHNFTGQPRHAEEALNGRLVAHSYSGQPSSVEARLYRPSPSLEGFAGFPNQSAVGVASRSSASDLYGFADTVIESESYPRSGLGSRPGGNVPPVVPARNSSYL